MLEISGLIGDNLSFLNQNMLWLIIRTVSARRF